VRFAHPSPNPALNHIPVRAELVEAPHFFWPTDPKEGRPLKLRFSFASDKLRANGENRKE
jgi:hypothetical protein